MRARAARCLRRNAALFWRWFLWWRKRYLLLRLALVLIIFAPAVYEVFHSTIRDLTIIAIQGIEDASLPKTGHYQAELIRLQETKRLQKALLKRFDADGNGRLSGAESRRLSQDTGLAATEVTARGRNADADRLIAGSKAANLNTSYQSARDLRKAAFAEGQAEVARWYELADKEIAPYLVIARPRARDYLRWRTWRRGIYSFAEQLRLTIKWDLRSRSLWFWLAVATIISVRRFGVGEKLQQRFKADAELAAAPCPVCGEATHDYGTLRAHRLARAVAAGVVVWLAVSVVLYMFASVRSEVWHLEWKWVGQTRLDDFLVAVLPAMACLLVAILRFLWWPWEIHACHRHPSLRTVGFAAGVLCVVVPLYAIALFCLLVLQHP